MMKKIYLFILCSFFSSSCGIALTGKKAECMRRTKEKFHLSSDGDVYKNKNGSYAYFDACIQNVQGSFNKATDKMLENARSSGTVIGIMQGVGSSINPIKKIIRNVEQNAMGAVIGSAVGKMAGSA